MKPKLKMFLTIASLFVDIAIYLMSAILAGLGLMYLIKEGKFSEALAIGGSTLVIFCKVDQVIHKLAALREEGQNVLKNV